MIVNNQYQGKIRHHKEVNIYPILSTSIIKRKKKRKEKSHKCQKPIAVNKSQQNVTPKKKKKKKGSK